MDDRQEIMLSGVRVTTRATDRKRQRSSYSAEAPLEGDAPSASGSGVQRGLPLIAPAPAPDQSTAASAASAALRVVQEQYTADPPTGEQAYGAQRRGNPC